MVSFLLLPILPCDLALFYILLDPPLLSLSTLFNTYSSEHALKDAKCFVFQKEVHLLLFPMLLPLFIPDPCPSLLT